ncbi:uncharacterized protein LOC130666770 [Microplitis mediator]|uniref:uncharacterized protein LOC130666770 n=1 Tax=Microplitis mediator TaxID=375433 RepID=UPI002556F00D|nr:uncharacterized protein LOC130666770 [Microplitis mediator]
MFKRKPGMSRTAVLRRNKKKLRVFVEACKSTLPIPTNLLEEMPPTSNTQFYPDTRNYVPEEDDKTLFDSYQHIYNDSGEQYNSSHDDSEDYETDFETEISISSEDEDKDRDNENFNLLYDEDEIICVNNNVKNSISDSNNDDDDNDDEDDSDDDNNEDEDDSDNDDNDDEDDDEHGDESFFQVNANGFNLPLLPKKNLTTKDHFLSVIATAMKHHMSYEAILDIFRWMKSSQTASRLPTTKAALWKVLSRNKSMITNHYYCKKCKGYLGKKNKKNVLKSECPCKTCGPKKSEKYLGFFLSISLASQIKQFLKIPNIVESLQYRYWRKKKNEEAFEDLYDGDEYKRFCLPGHFLEHWFNFSMTLNTDGCQISNSSRASAWPVYVEINELPPHLRKKYMLLAAIYVDDEHPKMNNFLRPFAMQMRKLYSSGITWKPTETTEVTSKFIVTVCSLDSPARAAVVRITQYNGYYGCLYCYAKGRSLSAGKLVYPFKQCYGRLRTDNALKADMKFATETGIKRHGLKGYSSLTSLPLFNIHKGVVVEAMHAVFLGVAKLHTTILLKATGAVYYIGKINTMEIIDKVLLSIRPPSRRSRKPRKLKFYSQWKASEWRNWLDYAPVCLMSVLEEKYVNHLALLSEAVHYLNNDSITSTDLDRADTLLKEYVKLFEKYFGLSKMTSNIHSLTHLVNCVRNWGPIWAHNAFIFESWNKKIIDSLTSPNGRLDQIATRFLMQRFINRTIFNESISSETRNYIKKTLKVVDETSSTERRNKFVVEGTSITRALSTNERIILQQAGYDPNRIVLYRQMRLNGVKFSCVNDNITRFSDSFIYNEIDRVFSTIEHIVQFKSDDRIISGIIVKNFEHVGYGFNTRHIHIVKSKNTINFIPETCKIRPAIKMIVSNVTYAQKLANCWETD